MNSNTSTVTLWQSGRLAPQFAAPRFEFTREHALGAAGLVLSGVVLAFYVGVLERAVDRSEVTHQVQRERAVAEAQCESGQPAALRGNCVALFNGDAMAVAADAVVVPAGAQDADASLVAVSMR